MLILFFYQKILHFLHNSKKMLEIFMLYGESPRALVTPVKDIRLGVAIYGKEKTYSFTTPFLMYSLQIIIVS